MTAKDITVIAAFAAILFIQEELLSFLPNVQLTVFLLVLYAKKLGFIRTFAIILIHVALDNLVMGSFNLVYVPAMLIGWTFVPLLVMIFGRKTENPLLLGIIGASGSFLYSWSFILPNYIIYHIDPLVYLAADILFEVILAACGFVSVLVLYKPMAKVLDKAKLTH